MTTPETYRAWLALALIVIWWATGLVKERKSA